MVLMRTLFMCGAISLSTIHCLASYELVLHTDGKTIYRFDPVTRANLGSFASEEMGGTGGSVLSLDPLNSGDVLAYNPDGFVRRWNYSTGIYKGAVRVSPSVSRFTPRDFAVASDGSYLILGKDTITGTSTIRKTTRTGALISSYTLPGADVAGGFVETPTGEFIVTSSQLDILTYNFFYTRLDASMSEISRSSIGSDFLATTYTHLAADSENVYIGSGSGFTTSLARNPYLDPPVLSGPDSTIALTSGGLNDLMWGHSGRLHAISSFGGPTNFSNLWYTYDTTTHELRGGSTPLPFTNYVESSVMVVAPEPASMLALGAGVFALARRRRR